MQKIRKVFSGVVALDDVDFTLRARRSAFAGRRKRRGQIDADQSDDRRIHARRRRDVFSKASRLIFARPQEAQNAGVVAVYQEVNLVDVSYRRRKYFFRARAAPFRFDRLEENESRKRARFCGSWVCRLTRKPFSEA